jgi:hypothetical protein
VFSVTLVRSAVLYILIKLWEALLAAYSTSLARETSTSIITTDGFGMMRIGEYGGNGRGFDTTCFLTSAVPDSQCSNVKPLQIEVPVFLTT